MNIKSEGLIKAQTEPGLLPPGWASRKAPRLSAGLRRLTDVVWRSWAPDSHSHIALDYRQENGPFHRRTFPRASLHPSSQRFHVVAMKGQGERPSCFTKYAVVWFLYLHWRKMLPVIHTFFRFPQPLVIGMTNTQVWLMCKPLMVLTGGQTDPRGRVWTHSGPRSSSQLRRSLQALAPATPASRVPLRAPLGQRLWQRWAGEPSQQNRSKTEEGTEERS